MRIGPVRQNGFTLVELLVVVAIIAVLIALLLPAVQSTREAARQAQCQNNLKQMGIALHAYHNARLTFPRGGWSATSADLSWSAAILPFLGEQPLFDSIILKVAYTNSANLAAGKTVLPEFICPSSHRDTLFRQSPDLPTSAAAYARSDYGAMDGERGLRSPFGTNSPERGSMILASNISLKEITDGTSQTIQIAEAPEGESSIWLSVKNLYDQSASINTLATYAPQYIFYDYGQEINSYHTGGAYALMVDGSVHFLAETVDNYPLSALCSRAGGEVIDDPF